MIHHAIALGLCCYFYSTLGHMIFKHLRRKSR